MADFDDLDALLAGAVAVRTEVVRELKEQTGRYAAVSEWDIANAAARRWKGEAGWRREGYVVKMRSDLCSCGGRENRIIGFFLARSRPCPAYPDRPELEERNLKAVGLEEFRLSERAERRVEWEEGAVQVCPECIEQLLEEGMVYAEDDGEESTLRSGNASDDAG